MKEMLHEMEVLVLNPLQQRNIESLWTSFIFGFDSVFPSKVLPRSRDVLYECYS